MQFYQYTKQLDYTDNKHCTKILQETLLNSVSNDCFPLRSDKVRIVLHCWVSRLRCCFSIVSRPFKCCARGTDRRHSEAYPSIKLHFFGVHEWMSSKKQLNYWTGATVSSVHYSWLCWVKKGDKPVCGFLLLVNTFYPLMALVFHFSTCTIASENLHKAFGTTKALAT
jgi:hypothetical protein